ncbi:MAG: acriflavine resistance protein B [Methylophilaceae bacterium]|nr:MAG: acriflavine resistance protein B [Methylophilaceae bacterium]
MANDVNRNGIIGWFAANSVAANLLMLLVVVLGVLEIGEIRKEAFPSRDPDKITISVSYDSGSATQSEEGIAIKIEEQLEDVVGVKTITTRATGSGVTVTLEKQSNYDLDALMRDVKSRVDAISSFPGEAKKPVIEKAVRSQRALWIQLHGDADRHTLQKLAYELKTDLLAHEHVNRVTVSGWLNPMMAIEIDEGKLQAYGLSLSDIETAIKQGSSNTITPTLRDEHIYLQLKASEQAYLKEDFASIPLITNTSGKQIVLGDVANIDDTYEDYTSSLSRFNGENSIALQVVTVGKGDVFESVTGARTVVDRWESNEVLPEGVKLSTWSDRSINIKGRLQLLIKNAGTGILLVFILLALFLNLTVAFWVAAGLPFIFLGTLYIMGDSFLGLTLNEFTTFGFILALGIVVDDAVVVGESVYAVRSEEGDTLENTIKGTMQVALPTLFGVLTTIAAFYALSQIEGRLGQIYAQFSYVVTICLVFSVIESKLILPAHLAHLRTHKKTYRKNLLGLWERAQKKADDGMNWFSESVYQPTIDKALTHRYAVAVLFIALFVYVIAMPFTGAVRISFFPEVTGDRVRAQLTMQKDSSFGQTHRNLMLMEQRAYEADRELLRDDDAPSSIESLQLLSNSDQSGKVAVELDANAPYDIKVFTKVWRQKIGSLEGAKTVSVQNRRGESAALRVELRANDDEILALAGEAFKKRLQETAGVSGIDDNLEPGQPSVNLVLTEQGRSLGLTTDMLAKQVLQAFNGQVVQRYQRNSDEIEVKVRYPKSARQNPTDIDNARIRTNDGSVVPLSSVATTTFGYTRDSITRIDRKRAVYISTDVDKDVISGTALVAQLKQHVVPDIEAQYPGLGIHFAGEAEQQAETQSSMVEKFILAILIIFILLAIPLRSYTQPFLIMTAIPFGIVGAIIGHWLNDIPLGILSLNGIVALSGVVVNDSLLLVSRYNDVKGEKKDIKQAISITCRSRLRAVLLTSFTTFAGLMPLLQETSMQAQFLIPAAVSLAYGIMFATVITLILIPSLLMIQEDVIALTERFWGIFGEKGEQIA